MRHAAFVFVFIAALGAATNAHAATPADAAEPNVAGWVGRYCTPTGCAGAPSSPMAQAASFGTAAFAIAFLARRRRA